jgi:hypothetical protein
VIVVLAISAVVVTLAVAAVGTLVCLMINRGL